MKKQKKQLDQNYNLNCKNQSLFTTFFNKFRKKNINFILSNRPKFNLSPIEFNVPIAKVFVVFRKPSFDASKHINKIVDNPYEWYNLENVKKTRMKYLKLSFGLNK